VKIGTKIVSHTRHVTFQMVEAGVHDGKSGESALPATIVGDWREPYRGSRLRAILCSVRNGERMLVKGSTR
jgi:hypothetical protein